MNQRNVGSASTSKIRSEGHSRWAGAVTDWLIHRAARSAPESLSQRLEEEWLADLEERPSVMSRLRFAIGCCWATRIIAHEHCASSVPAATAGLGVKSTLAYTQNNVGFVSRRTTALILVVCLHVAVFYAFMIGLSHTVGSVIPSPLQNRILRAPPLRELPPLPLPLPTLLNRPKLDVPIPEVSIAEESTANEVFGEVTERPVPPSSPPPALAAHTVKHVQGGPGAGFPNPDDFYPLLARHMEEQGVATVQVCVDVNGRLISDPTTLQSTGSSKLDEGALRLAKAGSGHYRATTDDGHPVNSCYPFRIRFQLKN
jgi:periplasmic protein TonB